MIIDGLTVCVDFSDVLAVTLPRWSKSLDTVTVVTTMADRKTFGLCQQFDNVNVVTTEVFYDRGADFNKGAAMNVGLADQRPEGWVLFFDADILPRWDWRDDFILAGPRVGTLYGAPRCQTDFATTGQLHDDWPAYPRLGDRQVAGYFQLFHHADPCAQSRPLLDDHWRHAGNYDTSFQDNWGEGATMGHKVFLDILVAHLGIPQRCWWGVRADDEDKLAAHRKGRRDHGGTWAHEGLAD